MPQTFFERIGRSIADMPAEKVFARWYGAKGQLESVRSFHGTWAASGEIAHLLRVELGLNKGDRVVLAYEFGLRFFVVFLGCLRAGIIAVPVYPPNPATLKKSLRKLQGIVDSCTPRMALVGPAVNKLRLASKLKALATGTNDWPDLPYNCPDVPEEATAAAALFGGWLGGFGNKMGNSFDDPTIQPGDVAFLQFTSGSTSDPKGVMVTVANLEHNTACLIRVMEQELHGEHACFSWLPTYHDMGLIQNTLAPFIAGWRVGFCSPVTFIRNPLIWLKLMSEEKSQISAAPDFAFRLCTRKWNEMTHQAQVELKLDLRHIVRLQSAAEPASTFRDFAKAFMPVGLPASFAIAAYGLAEHTVGASLHVCNAEGRDLDMLPDETLEAAGDTSYAVKFGDFKIVDPKTCREMPTGETGELWIASSSVAAGYWGQPELSREVFRATMLDDEGNRTPIAGTREYMRTGDLCRIDGSGLLFVQGRLKDLIIVSGRNIYPQDIEFAVQESSSLVRPGCVAAFSKNELGGDLEIVLEVRQAKATITGRVLEVLQAVRRAVQNEFGLDPTRVVAIKEKTIPKTTSGKIQRRRTRDVLHDGGLEVVLELLHDSASFSVSAASDNLNVHGPAPGVQQPPTIGIATRAPSDQLQEQKEFDRNGADDADLKPEEERGATQFDRNSITKETVRVVKAQTGIEDLIASDDLLDLGVDSLAAVRISSDLSTIFGLDLPPELLLAHPTAELATEYINDLRERNAGDVTVNVKEAPAPAATIPSDWDCAGAESWKGSGEAWLMGPMRGWAFRLAQTLLLALVLVQIFIALVPAWHYWTFLTDLASTSFGGFRKQPWLFVKLPTFGQSAEGSPASTLHGFGLLYALAPIIWFSAFTTMVAASKWVVLGVQAQGRIPLGNYAYLTWWYNNAMLNTWETIGGRWLMDTKLIILFYRLLGAKVAWSASIKVFLREFDSITIGEGAKVEGQLYARRFETSCMVTWPITIDQGAVIHGGAVVYGGAKVGKRCVVEPLTVIPPFSSLAPDSVWEGHPAKEVSKGCEHGMTPTPCNYDGSGKSCACDLAALLLEVGKQVSIVCTIVALTVMNYLPAIVFRALEPSEHFRYVILGEIGFRVIGIVTQLAALLVLLKWVLAGRVAEGTYQPNALRTWRRWYLGRLHSVVHAYFLVFNRYRRYDWWGAALGMDVGRGSVILMGYNPEDAHLIKVGSNAHLAYPIVSADREVIGTSTVREKRAISIGRHAMIGHGSHLSAGSSVGDGSQIGGYVMLRPGESLAAGMGTMSDVQSAYRLRISNDSLLHDTHGRQASATENIIDASCTVAAWIVNASAMVASFEAAKLAASVSSDDGYRTRAAVLWAVPAVVWAISTSVLMVLFKVAIGGNLHGTNAAAHGGPRHDIEIGLDGQQQQQKPDGHQRSTLTPSEVVRWRWMRRVLHFSLFEPLVIDPFLRGTWLLNAWLRLMGADVSMGSLVLGRVSDYGQAKVCDGAVVAGVLYGHNTTFTGGKWSMEVAPSTVGERGNIHNHARMFCMQIDAGSTLTASSSSLSGQILPAGKVCGGRPSNELPGNWTM